jgi:hypothetical protein
MTVSCGDVITLSAQVFGEALGATYFWEQVSGTPVDWLEDQNQAQVMFRQPLNRDDKVFRFWVNRGTSVQAFKDVLVSAIPTDYLKTSSVIFSGSKTSSESNVFTYVEPVELDIYPYTVLPGYNDTSEVIFNDSSRLVLFSNLKYSESKVNQTTYTLQEMVNGAFVDVLAIQSAEEFFDAALRFNIVEGVLYRLQKTYLGITTTVKNVSYTRSDKFDLSAHDKFTADQVKNSNSLSSVTEVITRSVVTENTAEDVLSTFSRTYFGGNSSIQEIISRSVVTQDGEFDTILTYSGTKSSGMSVVTEVRTLSNSSIG